MNSAKEMQVRAIKLEKAIESCRAMGWDDTADFYEGRLLKLKGEMKAAESFIAESAKTKGLPLPSCAY